MLFPVNTVLSFSNYVKHNSPSTLLAIRHTYISFEFRVLPLLVTGTSYFDFRPCKKSSPSTVSSQSRSTVSQGVFSILEGSLRWCAWCGHTQQALGDFSEVLPSDGLNAWPVCQQVTSIKFSKWTPRISRDNKSHTRGNPASFSSIPAVFPWYLYPFPRIFRGFHGIPAVPIPVQTLELI